MRRSKATSSTTGGPGDTRAADRGNFTPPSAAAAGDAAASPEEVSSGGRFSPRNWRVASKLYAILLIPVTIALVFGGLRVVDSYDTYQEADDAQRVAELVSAATIYAHALINERDVSTEPLLQGDRNDPLVFEARQATDRASKAFWQAEQRAPSSESLERRLNTVRDAESRLEPLREGAYGTEFQGVATEEGYVLLQHPLMALANELRLGTTGNVTSYGRTLYTLSLSKSASSLQRAIGSHLLVAPGPGEEATRAQLTAFSSYAYLERVAAEEFRSAGLSEDQALLDDTMAQSISASAAKQPNAPSLDEMVRLIASGLPPGELADRGITHDSWFAVATAEFDAYRTVESHLVQEAVEETKDVAATARRDAAVNAAIVLSSVLLALVLAGLVARSMGRSMRRLRSAAFEVAEQRLPAVVDQLSRTRPGEVDTHVTPIPITSRDEIGQVARAFDQVHREAVHLAAEQALLRGNVNAIFTNLSSRNQGLIERQLGLIGELESNEADPDQLEHLFKLDHLATRMRRNGENLLVLAGEEPKHRWNKPVQLVDVMRAAASEVEAYERIEQSGVPECHIHGAVVNDLVHLLAELLENATSFSSPHTRVRVTATRLPDGRIMIEIHDKGIGLTREDFAEINKRLADPPAVDVAVSRRMGLFVVGRLAERHGIRVQLRPSGEQTGTTSLVMLPAAITHGGSSPEPPEEEFRVSRIVPEGPYETGVPEGDFTQAQDPGAHHTQQLWRPRSAADLGFDDSRYPAGTGPQRHAEPALPPQAAAPPAGEIGAPEPQAAPAPGPAPASDPMLPNYSVPQQSHLGYDAPTPQQPGFGGFPPYTESPQGAPAGAAQRVGFTTPEPDTAAYGSSASAGVPSREEQWQRPEEDPAQRLREEPLADQAPGGTGWDRGPRREQRTGGTTSAGLPKRVPRANLAEHSIPESPQGGSQVSRDPEDVRGRLSSLHRGVRQGRGAGARRGRQDDEPGGGPGHTYDQER